MTSEHQYPTGLLRQIIVVTVMLVTIMEILDMTIVNVALPTMMGQLGANSEQITWILTSYVVSSAIVMPLTGFLVARLGRKKLLLINILGFLASSILCGLSTNLTEIVLFRTLQGVFGASLVPLSQYILRDIYPPEEQGHAMALWGIGVMVAPVLGPTLGGYITDALTWRWIFYINAPVCVLAFFLTLRYIPETVTRKVRVDVLGLILLAVGVGSLQLFLDQGNANNWFDSNFITSLFIIMIVALLWFVIRGVQIGKENIINLHLFKNRNFSLSTMMIAIFAMGMIGVVSIQPLLLERVMNYTSKLAGLALAPRGISAAISMFLVGQLVKKIDARILIIVGVLISDYGTYLMTGLNTQSSFSVIAWQTVVQGFGLGFFFVPISVLAFSTLKQEDVAEASGLFSFGRNMGISIGISILSTLVTRESQINWNVLGGHVTASNPYLHRWLDVHHLSINSPVAIQRLANMVSTQATMIAFLDAFYFIAIGFLGIILLTLFLNQKK